MVGDSLAAPNCLLDLFQMQEKIFLVFTHTLAHSVGIFGGGFKHTREAAVSVTVSIFGVCFFLDEHL